jgi:hypothetical protein
MYCLQIRNTFASGAAEVESSQVGEGLVWADRVGGVAGALAQPARNPATFRMFRRLDMLKVLAELRKSVSGLTDEGNHLTPCA